MNGIGEGGNGATLGTEFDSSDETETGAKDNDDGGRENGNGEDGREDDEGLISQCNFGTGRDSGGGRN